MDFLRKTDFTMRTPPAPRSKRGVAEAFKINKFANRNFRRWKTPEDL
jgi:hypothetical protein